MWRRVRTPSIALFRFSRSVAARCVVIGVAVLVSGCPYRGTRPAPIPEARSIDTLRVLFIGNSLTESHDLPGLVAELSRAQADHPRIETGAVVFNNYSLGDHLAQGDAARAIATRRWDIVTLQQGPSALPESRVDLLASVARFDSLIRAADARPALYGVWPAEARGFDLDASIESYRLAAVSVDGVLFPAGLAWKTAWQEDAALPLYSDDRFHPSPLGTYAAAVVIWARLNERSPVGLPSAVVVRGIRFDVSAEHAAVVQRAAETVTETRPR